MSEKDWYRVLLEEYCTMEVDHTGEQVHIKCRVERASPLTDWEKSWRLARLPGLGPENISFYSNYFMIFSLPKNVLLGLSPQLAQHVSHLAVVVIWRTELMLWSAVRATMV